MIAKHDLNPLLVTGLAWTLLFLAFKALPYMLAQDSNSLAALLWRVPGTLGVLTPFLAFAVGTSSRRPLAVLLVAGFACYMLLAFLNPVMTYIHASRVDLYPLGPMTPGTLVELLVRAKADPSAAMYPLAVENVFGRPANYLAYLLNAPMAAACFTVANGMLGRRASGGIGPIHHKAWVILAGIVSGLLFWVPGVMLSNVVRRSPDASGFLAAWLPLALPLFAFYVIKDKRPSPELYEPAPLRLVDDLPTHLQRSHAMLDFLKSITTPGMRSSEFLITIATAVLMKLGIFTPIEAAGVAAYVVSRGLAKLGK